LFFVILVGDVVMLFGTGLMVFRRMQLFFGRRIFWPVNQRIKEAMGRVCVFQVIETAEKVCRPVNNMKRAGVAQF